MIVQTYFELNKRYQSLNNEKYREISLSPIDKFDDMKSFLSCKAQDLSDGDIHRIHVQSGGKFSFVLESLYMKNHSAPNVIITKSVSPVESHILDAIIALNLNKFREAYNPTSQIWRYDRISFDQLQPIHEDQVKSILKDCNVKNEVPLDYVDKDILRFCSVREYLFHAATVDYLCKRYEAIVGSGLDEDLVFSLRYCVGRKRAEKFEWYCHR